MSSYLNTVKEELSILLEEKIDLRQVLKHQSFDQSSKLVLKLKTFEDFKERVLVALEHWDQKALELSEISNRYYNELEENKRLFMAMKQLIKDKDLLISRLQKQSKAKDQIQALHSLELKREIEKQSILIRHELLEQVKVLKAKVSCLEEERRDQDRRFETFKLEYAKVLEDRDSFKKMSGCLQNEIEAQTHELLSMKRDHHEQMQRIKMITNSARGGYNSSTAMD